MGGSFRVTKSRGQVLRTAAGVAMLATVRPSAILRGAPQAREQGFADLVADLRRAREAADLKDAATTSES